MEPIEQLHQEERRVLRAYFEAVAECRTEEERSKALAKRGWDQRRIRVVSNIFAKMRRLGIYASGVDDAGRLLFGQRVKGRLDQEMEQRGAEYEQRGKELLESRGIGVGVLKRMEA